MYLKIENVGVAPPEAFTLLGASTKRDSDLIGKFGSGNKHGISTLLREGLDTVVFCSQLRMTFGTKEQEMSGHMFNRVFVKFGGKDEEGKQRSATEDMGYVLEYGEDDWGHDVSLALREFVSNAIDAAGYKNVTIELVEDNQVRAKVGTTRVFVQVNDAVERFKANLGKWFLHFSEPENLGKQILPKRNRNIGDRRVAVIYRRGVRVREFESSDTPSLYDYNLNDLPMDEARKVDDWRVKAYAGFAFRDADKTTLSRLFQSFGEGEYWEHGFDGNYLDHSSYDSTETVKRREKTWCDAFTAINGASAVVSTESNQLVERKGFKVVKLPQSFVRVAPKLGIKTADKVLSQDEREGREIVPTTQDVQTSLDQNWDILGLCGLTNGKNKPALKCFREIMRGESSTLGFYRDATVFINADISVGLSDQLNQTMLEELAHWVTGATDNSRDFQDFAFRLAMQLVKLV
jgi:hypothetical protein